jgi:hypothetical protein
MLAERPEIGPGEWKQRGNRVGGREFVSPHLVEETLREAYRYYDSLPPGFARAPRRTRVAVGERVDLRG